MITRRHFLVTGSTFVGAGALGLASCQTTSSTDSEMSTPLTIVAHIRANPDQVELVKTELLKLIPITRAERGCIQYDLHQDDQDPAHFLFFENWESRELWQDHMNAPHLAGFIQATEGALAELVVHEMTQVG